MSRGFHMGGAGGGKSLPKVELTYANPSTYSTAPVTTDNSIVFYQKNFDTYSNITYLEFTFDCRANVSLTFANALSKNGSSIVNRYEIVNITTSTTVYSGQGATTVYLSAGSYIVRIVNLSGYAYGAGTNTITVA